MRTCIDCGRKLTKEIRSFHQPEIRCLECFEIHSEDVTKTLENMLKEMEPETNENSSS